MKRAQWLLVAALAAALLGFALLGGAQYVSLAYWQESRAQVVQWYGQWPWQVRLGFFVLYVLVCALSFPGAAVLTMAGAAVLGFWWALVLVSFASTIGATLAMLGARYALRDVVQRRFARQLADINTGLARDGALYLLSLRLIPVVPFFAINLAMGLTTVRVGTYYWVSQVGMLPGTVVYVNAGSQLTGLHSLADVASPTVWGAFALLGLFPLLAKWLRDNLVRRRVYAPWAASKPKHFDRNLIVIGAGAGGLVSAYLAAAAQAKVTLVEAHRMGGDCLHTGCVPSKTLIRSAHLAHQMRHASRYGLHSGTRSIHEGHSPISLQKSPVVDFAAVMQRVRSVIAAIAPHDSVERYTALGVDVVPGHARLRSPWEVEITRTDGSTQVLTTRSIVLATGAQPVVPDLPGLQAMGYLTSETLWAYLDTLAAAPERLVVLGGGPIGCELAQALARLGSRVTLVEQGPRLLPREDEDVSALLAQSLRDDGVEVLLATRALRCHMRDDRKLLIVDGGQGERELPLDALLCAVGRAPRLLGMGLEALGLLDAAALPTGATLQTLLPNIYAVGDVAGPYQYTHAAAHQAWYATVNALLGGVYRLKADYRALPSVTFTDPAVARVGLNRAQAAAQGLAVEETRYALDDLDRALCDGETAGFVQVLTAAGSDTILGVTIVGSRAAEMLPEWVLALQHGLGLNKVLGTVHAYPSWSEANQRTAGTWKRSHAPQALLRLAEKWHRWRRTAA